uniref:HAT C-terminal dimerisation domain-containing protein n=1 Tax=Solanum lycopersicum TaxID=4081 RepID=A0A3Q7IWF0_SOLLC
MTKLRITIKIERSRVEEYVWVMRRNRFKPETLALQQRQPSPEEAAAPPSIREAAAAARRSSTAAAPGHGHPPEEEEAAAAAPRCQAASSSRIVPSYSAINIQPARRQHSSRQPPRKCDNMLSLDVPTRWNSTYFMLDTAKKFEKAFERFDLYDASDDLYLSKMASGMKEKFKKYWGTPEKMNKIIFIPSVLDPRNKFMYVSFSLEVLLGKETENVVNKKVEVYLSDVFAIYVSKYKKSFKSQPSSSDSSDSSTSGISQNVSKNSLGTKLHKKKQKNDSGSLGVKYELDKYLLEDQELESEDFDILSWWKVNSPRFLVLSQLARDVLAIPMSSVVSECAFSTGGRILDPFRSSLTPKCVQCLICDKDWLSKRNQAYLC